MSNDSKKVTLLDNSISKEIAYDALPSKIKEYSERVAYNTKLLFAKVLEKGIYGDYQDMDESNLKYIFEIIKYFDIGYAFEDGENTYSGSAIPMQHVITGSEVFFKDIKKREDFKNLSDKEKFIRRKAKDVCYYHHERWDGHGYPEGLRMEEIPLLARMTSICYSFETLTYPKNNTSRLNKAEAIKEIIEGSSKQFDPLLVDAFIELEEMLIVEGQTIPKHTKIPKVVEKEIEEVKKEVVEPIKQEVVPEVKPQVIEQEVIEDKKYPFEMIYKPVVDIKDDSVFYYKSDMFINDVYLGQIKSQVYSYVVENNIEQVKPLIELQIKNIAYVIRMLRIYEKDIQPISIRLYEPYINEKMFIENLKELLKEEEISINKLVFEIPASMLVNANKETIIKIETLRKLGSKISIVGYGIGQHSFAILTKLDFDYVVIDKKFIREVTTNTRVGGMVRGLLDFVKHLDAKAICENITTNDQKETLIKYGYQFMEGPLIASSYNEDSIIRNLKG